MIKDGKFLPNADLRQWTHSGKKRLPVWAAKLPMPAARPMSSTPPKRARLAAKAGGPAGDRQPAAVLVLNPGPEPTERAGGPSALQTALIYSGATQAQCSLTLDCEPIYRQCRKHLSVDFMLTTDFWPHEPADRCRAEMSITSISSRMLHILTLQI